MSATLHALACLQSQADADAVSGYRLRYLDPRTGREPFATMAVFMQRLPDGFQGQRVRSTDSVVYCVVEGDGRIETDEAAIAFGPNDVFVVPSWRTHRFVAGSTCVLLGFSDRAAQEALGLWCEERPG